MVKLIKQFYRLTEAGSTTATYITSPFNPLLYGNEFTFNAIPTTGFVSEKIKEAAAVRSERERGDQPVASSCRQNGESGPEVRKTSLALAGCSGKWKEPTALLLHITITSYTRTTRLSTRARRPRLYATKILSKFWLYTGCAVKNVHEFTGLLTLLYRESNVCLLQTSTEDFV